MSEGPFSRTISGRVFDGAESVPGAYVRVEDTGQSWNDYVLSVRSVAPRLVTADASGFFRLEYAPTRYNLGVRRESDVLVVRGLSARSFDPQLGGEPALSGYKARVLPSTNPAAANENTLVYLVSGADARSAVTADGALDVTFRAFESTATLHAVELATTSRGGRRVVRAGTRELRLRSGATLAPEVATIPFPVFNNVTFVGRLAPSSFKLESLSVECDFGLRTSSFAIASGTLDDAIQLTLVPGLSYFVRAVATSGAARSATGRVPFDPAAPTVALTFPQPVSAEAPVDEDAPSTGLAPVIVDPESEFSVRIASGVVEHLMKPAAGVGPSLRIVTSERAVVLPDATLMGLGRPVGRYTWTTEHFPTVQRVEALGGPDGRVALPSWRSAPRPIILR